jgi:hypothetical protein
LVGGQQGIAGVGLAMIATCLLVSGLTSASIGQTPELWIIVAMVTVLASVTHTKTSESN